MTPEFIFGLTHKRQYKIATNRKVRLTRELDTFVTQSGVTGWIQYKTVYVL